MYSDQKPTVVVRVKDGRAQDVIANMPIDLMVANYDVAGLSKAEVKRLPTLPSLDDDDGDQTVYVPAKCEDHKVCVDPAMTESLVRTGRFDFVSDPAKPTPPTFTVFVQQADGRGTVHISDYEAATPEEAAAAALERVAGDWGTEDEPWDRDDLRILGIARGNFDIIEWNDLDE